MKKLSVTKENYNKSDYFKNKYGNIKYVSESGKIYKTDKGNIIKLISEAREYVDDTSIEPETAEEFIIFEDPEILTKISELQNKKNEEVKDEVQSGEVDKKDIAAASAQALEKAGTKNALATLGSGIASSAINSATSLATSKAAMGVMAAIGYKKVLDQAAEVGDAAGTKVGDIYSDMKGYNDNMNAGVDANTQYKAAQQQSLDNLSQYTNNTGSNLGTTQDDKRALYIATQLQNGGEIKGGKGNISQDQAKEWLDKHGYEINKDGVVNKITNTATSAATGAAASGGISWLGGISGATLGWAIAGVAAIALITPYIYDKVRACTKTWMSDIIAETKFKADGKNYRCFYDIKDNKWVLTYADIKWTSYMDNKLDDETINDFFASQFFKDFLGKCNRAFAMLFSFKKNEAAFKAIPEIKDAPKELKEIIQKIYDNKGAIMKNMFTGKHD